MIVFFLAEDNQPAKNGPALFVPDDPEMMSRFSRSKGKLICPQNTESLFHPFQNRAQAENWL